MTGRVPDGRAFVLRLLAGPAAFAVVSTVPVAGLASDAQLTAGVYAWLLVWWMAMPVPWAITAFLPLVILPILGVMAFPDVAARYGHTILPYLMGVMLFGHAFQKHGLARRIALAALSLPGAARSGSRLVLAILVVSVGMSAVISDLAVIVTLTPIALSIVRTVAGGKRMAAAACLAVLYGANAGGVATPAANALNAMTLTMLETLTDYSVTFVQWASTGVILAVAHLPICYLILRVMLPPEVQSISEDRTRFLEERERLGPMSRGERNVLFVLVLMLVLWVLPTFVDVGFLSIWYVPAVAMVLLFALPVDAMRGRTTLEAEDFQVGISWNVACMVLGGAALADILADTGAIDWLATTLTDSVNEGRLPWLAAGISALLTQVTNGAAAAMMTSTALFPVAEALGYNPAILARIIAGSADSVMFPWSSPTAAATFAFGAVGLGTMFRVGLAIAVVTPILMVVLSGVLVSALQAFTAP